MKQSRNNFNYFLCGIVFFYSCKSYEFHKDGRVSESFYSYYLNETVPLVFVLYGDMGLKKKPDGGGTSVNKFYPHDKAILRQFKVSKHDKILFTSRPKIEDFYNVLGVLRTTKTIDTSDYTAEKSIDDSLLYWRKTLKFNGRDAIENLLLRSKDEYISLIYYIPFSSDSGNLQDLQFIVNKNTKWLKSGKTDVPYEVVQMGENYFESSGYLAASRLADKKKDFFLLDQEGEFDQVLASHYSFSNQLQNADNIWLNFAKGTPLDTLKEQQLSPAKEEILKIASREQVIMFNQAHYKPEHAFFVASLLKDLRSSGFTYLAMEGINDADTLSERGYPNLDDGFYLKDPVMGNLIRNAIALGYKLVDYEAYDAKREFGQAKNLYEKTISKDPKAKVIVLAGYAHIYEKPLNGTKWMAAYFKNLSGINPFTIDQTAHVLSPVQISNALPEGVYIVKRQLKDSLVDIKVKNLINTGNKGNDFSSLTDLGNIEIKLPELLNGKQMSNIYSFLVYKEDEILKDENSIPVFVKVINGNNGGGVSCSLDKGNYIIQCRDVEKKIIWKENLRVDN